MSRKLYIRKTNIVDYIKTRQIVIAHLLPWSGQENCLYITLLQ